jgi:hypothetical protein
MKRLSRYLDVLWIVLLAALFLVPTALAQDGAAESASSLLAPFAPILAASAAIERLLQLIRNIINPKPEEGFLARGSVNLARFTTYGGVALGLILAFMSGNLRILALAGVQFDPALDTILTGIVIGMGTEFVHEVIKVVGEGKDALRANAKSTTEEKQAKG